MTDSLVERMAQARRGRTELTLDGAPTRLEEAYPISAAVLRTLGEQVGGWKVGHDPASGTPMGAPMYASGFVTSGARFPLAPGRTMIPEVEIAVRLARDLAPRADRPWTRADMLDAAQELLLGFELIERRIPAGAPFAFNLADDLGNVGYVVGPAVRDFRSLDIAALRCRFWIDDDLVVDRRGGHPKGDPLAPMVDWANHACDRLGGMKAGEVVTLGSLTPLKTVNEPSTLRAQLEGFGEIEIELV
jgi:2-keto-4-pentenoate hydratase